MNLDSRLKLGAGPKEGAKGAEVELVWKCLGLVVILLTSASCNDVPCPACTSILASAADAIGTCG